MANQSYISLHSIALAAFLVLLGSNWPFFKMANNQIDAAHFAISSSIEHHNYTGIPIASLAAMDEQAADLQTAVNSTFGLSGIKVVDYGMYPLSVYMKGELEFEQAFNNIVTEVEQSNSIYLLIARQFIDGAEVRYKVRLKMPKPAQPAMSDADFTGLQSALESICEAGINNAYEANKNSFVALDAQARGIEKLVEAINNLKNNKPLTSTSNLISALEEKGFLNFKGNCSEVFIDPQANYQYAGPVGNVHDFAGALYKSQDGASTYTLASFLAADASREAGRKLPEMASGLNLQPIFIVTHDENYGKAAWASAESIFQQDQGKIIFWIHLSKDCSYSINGTAGLTNEQAQAVWDNLQKGDQVIALQDDPQRMGNKTNLRSTGDGGFAYNKWLEPRKENDSLNIYVGVGCGIIDAALEELNAYKSMLKTVKELGWVLPSPHGLNPVQDQNFRILLGVAYYKLASMVTSNAALKAIRNEKAQNLAKTFAILNPHLENISALVNGIANFSLEDIQKYFNSMIGDLKAWLSEFISDIISGNLKKLGYSIGKQLGAVAIDLLKAAFSGAAALAIKAVAETLKKSGRLTSLFGEKITNRTGKKQCADLLKGLCFGAGTLVLTSSGHIPIEAFSTQLLANSAINDQTELTASLNPFNFTPGRFGKKLAQHSCNTATCAQHGLNEPLVWTYSPDHPAVISGEQDTEEITPEGWKWVRLEMANSGGTKSEILLRRPNLWLAERGMDQTGRKVILSEPEMNLWGSAEVVGIYPNTLDTRLLPEIRSGDYLLRPVSGFFSHPTQVVEHLHFSGSKTPLTVTPNHPLYSLDRHAFVPAGMIRVGERLKTMQGELRLSHRMVEDKQVQSVYNLEVWRGGSFLVGEDEIVVNDGCGFSADFIKKYAPWADNFLKDSGIELQSISKDDDVLSEMIKYKLEDGFSQRNVATLDVVEITPAISKNRYDAVSGYGKDIDTNHKAPSLEESKKEQYIVAKKASNVDTKGNPCQPRPGGPLPGELPCFYKLNDTEAKILENLAQDIEETIRKTGKSRSDFKGAIELTSELFPCKSCADVIMEFRRLYPNIKIKIFAQAKTTGAQ